MKVYLFGFSRWKHRFIKIYLSNYFQENIHFINPLRKNKYYELALRKGLDNNSDILIWGDKKYPNIDMFAKKHSLNITRVEDGFVRSISLGSDLTPAYSLVFDDLGMYFNPNSQSRLEKILGEKVFDTEILNEANEFYKYMLKYKISKYSPYSYKKITLPSDKKKILIAAQIDDDASVRYGAQELSNLKLIQKVRKENPHAYIVFKSHPDVVSGNRAGRLSKSEILKYCDVLIDKEHVIALIEAVDEVHTMTSLVGLEGLIHGKKVAVYGQAFYAGWGLTYDKQRIKRSRELSLLELIAGVYIAYPSYISPLTKKGCSALEFIDDFVKYQNSKKVRFLTSYYLPVVNMIGRARQKLFRFIISLFNLLK